MAQTKTVPVKFLDTGDESVDTGGGITAEMCPECFSLVPTEKIQLHIDKHPQLTGQNLPEQPEQPPGEASQQPSEGAPPPDTGEPGTPETGVPGTPEQQPSTGTT